MPEYDLFEALTPDAMAGGGCPGTYETLVPHLPFDFLQPQMRKQVTQVGYGGPFVIRSNPIGAIVDAIRGFCFPAPMEQVSSDGGEYADLSGYTMDPLGQAGGSYGGGGFGQGVPPTPSMNCGSGTMWDTSQMMCVPTPGAAMMPGPAPMPAESCDYLALVAEGAKLGAAKGTNDVRETCRIIGKADSCIAAAGANETLRKQWTDLKAAAVKQANDQTKNAGCAAWINAHPAPAAGMTAGTPPGMPSGTGTTTPPAGGSPGSNNMGGMNPPPGMGPGMGPGMMNVENPPTAPPANSIFGFINTAGPNAANALYSLKNTVMPPMPVMPNPASLTEGNIYMLPTAEPMGGSFDPSRIPSPERATARRPGPFQRQRPAMAVRAYRGGNYVGRY